VQKRTLVKLGRKARNWDRPATARFGALGLDALEGTGAVMLSKQNNREAVSSSSVGSSAPKLALVVRHSGSGIGRKPSHRDSFDNSRPFKAVIYPWESQTVTRQANDELFPLVLIWLFSLAYCGSDPYIRSSSLAKIRRHEQAASCNQLEWYRRGSRHE
jgi:hypothetical protein